MHDPSSPTDESAALVNLFFHLGVARNSADDACAHAGEDVAAWCASAGEQLRALQEGVRSLLSEGEQERGAIGPMGLRLAEGMAQKAIEAIAGFPACTPEEKSAIADLVASRLLNAEFGDGHAV